MTTVDLAAAGHTMPLCDAAQHLGIGRSKAYQLVRQGEWPTRVLRLGDRIRIPTAELRRLLGIET